MKWTRLLAIATVLFASTTVYFAHALKVELDEQASPAVAGPAPVAAAPTVASDNSDFEALPPGAIAVQPDASPVRPAVSGLPSPQEQIAMRRAQLERLTDPRKRAEKGELRLSYLREGLAGPARHLGLTREQVESLAGVLDEQDRRDQESRLRCELDPTCTVDLEEPRFDDTDRAELAQLLGRKQADAFVALLDSSVERGQVERFRERLSKQDDLSDEQEDRLVSAIVEERQQFVEAARRDKREVWGLANLKAAVPRDAVDRQVSAVESATQFSHRLRERAAVILTPAQFTAYDEMLAEELRLLSKQKVD